jgi:hypothetical protein
MTDTIDIGGAQVALRPGWREITSDLPPGTPPTFARSDGSGALRFSVARYVEGKKHDVSQDSLRRLVLQLGIRRGLGRPRTSVDASGKLLGVFGDYSSGAETHLVWYVSDGEHLALVTYLALATGDHAPVQVQEVEDARVIVDSLSF